MRDTTKQISKKGIALLTVAILAFSTCSTETFCTSSEEESSQQPIQTEIDFHALIENCTLDDVVGEHNPKMIAIWGGMLTHESWFLRYAVREWRWQLLKDGLNHYYALYNCYPVDFETLNKEGFFSIRHHDPVTGAQYNFGHPVTSETDFLNIDLVTSSTKWTVIEQNPDIPDGKWAHYESTILPDQFFLTDFTELRTLYPNVISMRGSMLADSLQAVLRDYFLRRNEMPRNTDQMFDGLWSVEQAWAEFDQDLDLTQPSTFYFGIDSVEEWAVAIWSDSDRNQYWKVWGYTPWPEDGWEKVPTVFEWGNLFNRYAHQWDQSDNWASRSFNPSSCPPEIILWQCSLLIEDL